MGNSTPKWRSQADRFDAADKKHFKQLHGRTIFGHRIPAEPEEDRVGVRAALRLIEEAISLHKDRFQRDPDGTEPPWPDRPTEGEIYRIVQDYRESREICSDMPRVTEVAHRIEEIGHNAQKTREHLETADEFTLWKIWEALDEVHLASADSAYKNKTIERLIDDHGDLYDGRESFIGTVLSVVEQACTVALNSVPEDDGNPVNPFGWSPEVDFVNACLTLFDIYCPGAISSSLGSKFQEFVVAVDVIATGGKSDLGRKIIKLVRRHKKGVEHQRLWEASEDGLFARYSQAYERRRKCEASLRRAAESGADSDPVIQEELAEIRRELAQWRDEESVFGGKLDALKNKN